MTVKLFHVICLQEFIVSSNELSVQQLVPSVKNSREAPVVAVPG